MCKGVNKKRVGLSLLLAGIFGVFCAYGTSTIDIPGMTAETMNAMLLTVFYGRLLIGVLIGFTEQVEFLKNRIHNAVVRGAVMGAVVTPVISLYGGFEIFMAAGVVYGILTDLIATKLSS